MNQNVIDEIHARREERARNKGETAMQRTCCDGCGREGTDNRLRLWLEANGTATIVFSNLYGDMKLDLCLACQRKKAAELQSALAKFIDNAGQQK